MRVLPEKLGLTGEEALDAMDIRCSTIMIGSPLSTKGFLPAYHMNKNHWISIILGNSVPDNQITPLLELLPEGVHVLAESDVYPTDGCGQFFWNVSNHLEPNPATALVHLSDDDYDYNYERIPPKFLYPSQRRYPEIRRKKPGALVCSQCLLRT